MNVSAFALPFLAALGFAPPLDSSELVFTEIELLIFCTIQLKMVP